MRKKLLLVVIAVAALMALLFVLFNDSSEPLSKPSVDQAPKKSIIQVPASESANDHPSSPERTLANTPQRIDAENRAKVLAAILQALGNTSTDAAQQSTTRVTEKRSAHAPEAKQDQGKGSLDKNYIKAQIKEIVPLVKECFEMAIEQQPTLQGTLNVTFTIIGDDENGGLIETSEIAENKLNQASPDLEECVRETMYGLKFKAPRNKGRVKVTYPFTFKIKNDEEKNAE